MFVLGDGDVTIESSEVKPRQLCELGGEIITVPLSSQCRIKGKMTLLIIPNEFFMIFF
jgi:hypothetical protein